MTTLRRAAKQAFVDMACMRDMVAHPDNLQFIDNAITALRTALAEPEQEPLTAEEVIEHFQTQVDTGSLMSFVEGVRYAERAHGIGGEA